MRINIHDEIGWLGRNGARNNLDALIDALKNFRQDCDVTTDDKAWVSLDIYNGILKLSGTRNATLAEIEEAERDLIETQDCCDGCGRPYDDLD